MGWNRMEHVFCGSNWRAICNVLSSNPLCQVYLSIMSNAINMFFFDSCTWNPHLFDESSLSFPDLADSLTAPAEGYGLGGSLWTVECHGLRVTAGAVAGTADVKVREPCGGLVGWFLQKLDKNIGSKMLWPFGGDISVFFHPFSEGSYLDHSTSTVQRWGFDHSRCTGLAGRPMSIGSWWFQHDVSYKSTFVKHVRHVRSLVTRIVPFVDSIISQPLCHVKIHVDVDSGLVEKIGNRERFRGAGLANVEGKAMDGQLSVAAKQVRGFWEGVHLQCRGLGD